MSDSCVQRPTWPTEPGTCHVTPPPPQKKTKTSHAPCNPSTRLNKPARTNLEGGEYMWRREQIFPECEQIGFKCVQWMRPVKASYESAPQTRRQTCATESWIYFLVELTEALAKTNCSHRFARTPVFFARTICSRVCSRPNKICSQTRTDCRSEGTDTNSRRQGCQRQRGLHWLTNEPVAIPSAR